MVDQALLAEMEEDAGIAELPAPKDAVEAAGRLADELAALDQRITRGQDLLAELEKRRNQILSRELVDVMDAAKMDHFGREGRTFRVKPYYKASIPEEYRDVAHNWLEAQNHGDLIKYQIVVTMPKDSERETALIVAAVKQISNQAEVEVKRAVPWARLTSWLRELWEDTSPDKVLPPLDIMGATIGRVVKIEEKRR